MMGRSIINNGDVPNCIHYDKNDIDGIIKTIKTYERFTRLNNYILSKSVSNYLNVGDDFLNTSYYESVHSS